MLKPSMPSLDMLFSFGTTSSLSFLSWRLRFSLISMLSFRLLSSSNSSRVCFLSGFASGSLAVSSVRTWFISACASSKLFFGLL